MKLQFLFVALALMVNFAQAKSICIGLIENQTDESVQLRGVTMAKKSPQREFVEVGPNERAQLSDCPDGQHHMFRTSFAMKGENGLIRPNSYFFYDSPNTNSPYSVFHQDLFTQNKRVVERVIYDPENRDHHDCYVSRGANNEKIAHMKVVVALKNANPTVQYSCMKRGEMQGRTTSLINLK